MKSQILIFLMACFLIGKALADDGQFSLSSDLDSNTGKFETGPWAFKLNVPFASSTVVAPGIRFNEDGIANNAQETVAAATYSLYAGNVPTFGLDLSGKIKLGIADKLYGLGTGLNDYMAQADAYQHFEKFTALGSLGYRIQGSPTGVGTDNLLYGSIGGMYRLNDQVSGGVDFNLSQRHSTASPRQREFTAYLSHQINKNFKAKGYVLKGFSNGSPDTGVGAQVYYGF